VDWFLISSGRKVDSTFVQALADVGLSRKHLFSIRFVAVFGGLDKAPCKQHLPMVQRCVSTASQRDSIQATTTRANVGSRAGFFPNIV